MVHLQTCDGSKLDKRYRESLCKMIGVCLARGKRTFGTSAGHVYPAGERERNARYPRKLTKRKGLLRRTELAELTYIGEVGCYQSVLQKRFHCTVTV